MALVPFLWFPFLCDVMKKFQQKCQSPKISKIKKKCQSLKIKKFKVRKLKKCQSPIIFQSPKISKIFKVQTFQNSSKSENFQNFQSPKMSNFFKVRKCQTFSKSKIEIWKFWNFEILKFRNFYLWNAILGTCLATFVFMSRLKTECL